MIQGKKIFITGGSGFIGTALCERLVEKNKITIYDIMLEGRNTLKLSKIKDHPNLTLIKADILDKEKLSQAIQDHEIILHLAAIAGVSSYYKEPERTMKVNLLGTLNLLDTLAEKIDRENFKPELVIDFSTSEVYGNSCDAKETQPLSLFVTTDDRGSYSISKAASERLLFIYGKKYNFKTLAVRPFNIYGPGQLGEGAISNIIKRSLKNQDISITGDGTAVRAWCYIDDFLDCLLLAIENKGKYDAEILNIGNPYELETTASLAKRIIKMSNSSSKISFIPHIGTEINTRIPNISKATQMFGYKPQIDIEEGLKKTIEWYRRVS